MYRIVASGALYLGLVLSLANGQNCAEDKVRKCIGIAEPMLKDPHLIFPDNMDDINNVCRTWASFVECIRRYIDKCFTKGRKEQFNSAVEPPIASVHQMCSISSYQSEYLQYAGCIKQTVIEPEHCGNHYRTLVSEVSQESVRKPNLCCAYHNFRSCVILKTRLRCDGNQPEGIAARFSRQVLDKAFRFLQDQCINYIPDTSKCLSMMRNSSASVLTSRLGEGRSVSLEKHSRTTPRKSATFVDSYRGKTSDVYDVVTNTANSQSTPYEDMERIPDFTTNLDSHSSIGVQIPLTSASPPPLIDTQAYQTVNYRKVNDETSPAGPEEDITNRKSEPTHPSTNNIVETSSVPVATPSERPSSFGRGISWTSPPTPSTPEIPDWATSSWLTHNQDLTTEEIYPAAGSFGGNNIDEPNQQGLQRNGADASHSATLLYIFVISVCAFAFN